LALHGNNQGKRAKISLMDKAYEPAKYEAELYKLWEESGAFKPTKKGSGEPFSIILPPPNANGDLHVGHAMYVIEDIMARHARMQGRATLWLPGADHAGIETQVVFERELAKKGKTRFDLGREEFYNQTWDYTQKNMSNMTSQLRSLGFSLDWSRFKFTLDNDVVETVYETFKQMHKDGLVYRGNRIINWCPSCQSSFADIEIKYREQIDPLYYVKYGPFVVATVRPEPMFADTAIAVNPKDERYQKWIGKEVEVELLWGKRKLPVIADEHVDSAFGTGVIKVTPAHDPNDWEMAQKHNLEVISGVKLDGTLTDAAGKYAGMKVQDARTQVAHDLDEKWLMDHVDMNYTHSVATHDRCGTLIEPLVTEQWWLKVDELVKPAIKAIESGEVTIVPSRFKKVALDWLANLRDWNISRQNWWGIRIPVYYGSDPKKEPYFIGTEAEAEKYYGKGKFEAETDTFDTWFSSGQWPFATLQGTGDFDTFYPTSVMETGRDILFLWVTRMIMLGLYRTGKVPFKTVYLHGMVNDAHGKKMSKSKGNVISPLTMTEKYGTDALRLALTIGITPGNDGSLSEEKIAGYRNFNNKLWNVARFVLEKAGDDHSPAPPQPKSLADEWILGAVARETAYVSKAIEGYRFSEAGQAIYSLLWNDFADWYIEASKGEANVDVLIYVLETILKLVHPFAPFVTEAIWQKMAWHKQNLIVSAWPDAGERYTASVKDFERLRLLINEIRSTIHDRGLSKPTLEYQADQTIVKNAALVKRLGLLGEIREGTGPGLALTTAQAWLVADKEQIAASLKRLEAERVEKFAYVERLERQLANKTYIDAAPAQVVEDTRNRLTEAKVLLSKLDEELKVHKKA
jgi:valyl-tRNA synthetase